MEVLPEPVVDAAAMDTIRLGAISFDAVKLLVIAKVERIPARLARSYSVSWRHVNALINSCFSQGRPGASAVIP